MSTLPTHPAIILGKKISFYYQKKAEYKVLSIYAMKKQLSTKSLRFPVP